MSTEEVRTHPLEWIALGFTVAALSTTEWRLAVATGAHPAVAVAIPGALDVYAIRAMRTRRQMPVVVAAMVGVNALGYLVHGGVIAVTWPVLVFVSAIAPMVFFAIHLMGGEREHPGNAGTGTRERGNGNTPGTGTQEREHPGNGNTPGTGTPREREHPGNGNGNTPGTGTGTGTGTPREQEHLGNVVRGPWLADEDGDEDLFEEHLAALPVPVTQMSPQKAHELASLSAWAAVDPEPVEPVKALPELPQGFAPAAAPPPAPGPAPQDAPADDSALVDAARERYGTRVPSVRRLKKDMSLGTARAMRILAMLKEGL